MPIPPTAQRRPAAPATDLTMVLVSIPPAHHLLRVHNVFLRAPSTFLPLASSATQLIPAWHGASAWCEDPGMGQGEARQWDQGLALLTECY